LYVDLVLHNGTFITLNEKEPFASSIAVKDGKIFRIGEFDVIKPYQGKNTKVLDLHGRTAIPGFIDSHIHIISLGLDMQVMDLGGVSSKSAILSKLERVTKGTPPRNWIKGYGFDEALMDELPNIRELNSISPENPVYLESLDSLMCIVNSLALDKVYMEHDIEGVTIEKNRDTGDITGVIRVDDEKLLHQVARVPTLDPVDADLPESELELAIEIASKKVLEAGITSIHDPQLPPNALRAFKNAVRDGRTPLRLYLGCDRNREIELGRYIGEGVGTKPYPIKLKMGMVKLFADDRISIQELKERAKEANQLGLQLSIHATNIHEMRNALEAIEEALEDTPRNDHRHRIEHADNIDEDILERAVKMNLIVAVQPEIVYKLEPKYPQDVMRVAYHTMMAAGINVSGGSDSPTVPIKRRARPPLAFPTPILGMAFAVTRTTKNGLTVDKDESVSVLDSLRIHTINGAYASFEEDVKGSLEEGKLADLAILSDNPLRVDHGKIKEIEVEMTIIGGEIVFTKEKNVWARTL
jgi:predicted amidohydrolase YtcJ